MKKDLMMVKYKDILIDISPKAGTNTILNAISKDKLSVGSDKKKGTYWNHFSNKIITEISEENKKLDKIKIMRHPKNRALSVYLHYMRHLKVKDFNKITPLSFFEKIKKIHDLPQDSNSSKNFYRNNLDYITELFGNIDYKIFELFLLQKNKITVNYNFIATLENLNLLTDVLREKKKYNLIFTKEKLNKAANKKNINYFDEKSLNLIKNIYSDDYDIYFSKDINKWSKYE